MEKNNKVTITKNQIPTFSEDFVLQIGDIIVRDDTNSTLVVVNVGYKEYALVSIVDDFNRWNDDRYSLEDLTRYVKRHFYNKGTTHVYRNNSIDITLGKEVN